VFVAALAVRLRHVADIGPSPFFGVLVGDARAYDAWAQRIAAGDWIGREVFYQAPLYPYFLGTIYALFGHDLLIVRLVQVTLGALACSFLAIAGARLFGRGTGVMAGLLLAVYAPAVFFDALIQKTVLDGILICLALLIVSGLVGPAGRADPDRVGLPFLALGFTLGMLALTRENAMVLIAVVVVWSIVRSGEQDDRSLAERLRRRTAPFLLALAVVLLPVALRNYAVGGGFFVTTSQFGSNLYLGNNPSTDGTAGSLIAGRGSAEYEQRDAIELAERASGRSLSPGEVSSYWTGRALSFITSQPIAWVKLMARKTLLLVNTTEMLDTESQESYAEWSAPLRIGGYLGHFGVLVPLAAIGLVLTWPERRRLWILYALAGAYAASVVLFFIYARYRYPLVPFLILFASAAIVGIYTQVRLKPDPTYGPYGRLLGATAMAALIAATNLPMLSASRMRAITEHNYGAALQGDKQFDEAVAHYERAVAADPAYAPAYSNMGAALSALGRIDAGKRAYQRALEIDPEFADAHINLGNALRREGNAAAAVAEFEKALALSPASVEAVTALAATHYDVARALLENGRAADAIPEFEKAVRLAPDDAETRNDYGIALATAGRVDDARLQFREALRLSPRFEAAARNLAALPETSDKGLKD
jgi:Flp pilus assembly protein TadD/4-amino-4-deoxy-L-arabinose transferase-like glycosyltransferase